MVRSTVSEEERESWNAVFKFGFVFVVAGSSGLIALQGGASLVEIALLVGVGAAFGWLLLRYLLWAGKRSSTSGRRRRFR